MYDASDQMQIHTKDVCTLDFDPIEDQWHYMGIEIPAPLPRQIDNHSVSSSLELLCASQNAKTTVSRHILVKSARKMHARPEN